MSWRILIMGLISFALSGCAYDNYEPPHARKASVPATRPVASAQVLANDTAAYARTVEEQMNRRRTNTPTTREAGPLSFDAVSKPAESAEIGVRWIEPKEVQLSLGPPQSSRASDKATPNETLAANVPTVAPGDGGAKAPEPRAVPPSLREEPITSDELARKLMGQIKANARNLSALVDWQLLRLLNGHSVPEMEWVGALSGEDLEIVSALMDALTTFRSTLRNDDNAMFSKKVRPFMEMADRLRTKSELRVPTIALCSRVDGFGVYEPVDPGRFREGREHKVILYFEVENFASRLADSRQWETKLTESAILYNDRSQRVWEDGKQLVADSSRNRRHDFFGRRIIQLPATLPAGKYLLKVNVTDQLASRFAEESLAVEVLER